MVHSSLMLTAGPDASHCNMTRGTWWLLDMITGTTNIGRWQFLLSTHWGQDEMDNISQMTFLNTVFSMKMLEFRLRLHWSLFLGAQSTMFQHWFRKWLGAGLAASHYLNQWWSSLLTHICGHAATMSWVAQPAVNNWSCMWNSCRFEHHVHSYKTGLNPLIYRK